MATKTKRGEPSVVRICKPDSAAQAEAVRLLIEQVTAKPGSPARDTDEKQRS